MTKDDIILYEYGSLNLVGSFFYRMFPKLLDKRIDRKMRRYNYFMEKLEGDYKFFKTKKLLKTFKKRGEQ
jgi:hypothetical protein